MTGSLTVLGSCGAWPEAGRACSGFLLDAGGARIALDLGYGTLPRLLTLLGSNVGDGLDAVVITHHHPDHVVDLHGLFRARWFGHRDGSPLPLFAPAGVLRVLTDLEDGEGEPLARVFDWVETPAPEQVIGALRLTTRAVPHFVPSVAIRLETPDVVVAYTGDSGPSPVLDEIADGADLLVAEASDRTQQPETPPPPPGPRLHLDASAAGRLAARAKARRLLLTHFWPGNDREASREAAAADFGGEVLLADEGLQIRLG